MTLHPTVVEALLSSVQQVRAAIPSAVGIGLYLPDSEGRLELVHLDGEDLRFLEKRRALLRQSVLETATSERLALEHPPGYIWLGMPLAFHGRSFGVLTLIAPREPLQLERRILEVIASQTAGLLAASVSVREQREQLGLELACTAHELRGPVAAAQVAIAYALRRGVPDPDSSDLLGRSHRELEELTEVVAGLLRWGAGDADLEERPVDLLEVTQDAVDSCTQEAGGGRVKILAADRAEVSVHADRVQLKIAIANLVRNALSHAPPGTDVEIGVQTDDGRIRLSVVDRGPGVADDDREIIFEPAVLGRNGHRAEENRGLGLFIARRIVEAHGGGIWVGSGPGATFVIELPGARGARARAS